MHTTTILAGAGLFHSSMCVSPTITHAGSSVQRAPIGEVFGAPLVGHSSDHATLLKLSAIRKHNSVKQMNLIAFAWLAMFNSFLLFLLNRCCLLLLDRAAPRHSSRYAELRQYPKLHREIEHNKSNDPDHIHGALPSCNF
jgi:hypothetical protein